MTLVTCLFLLDMPIWVILATSSVIHGVILGGIILHGDDKREITVRDTGIGIGPAQQALIFEDFVQADASITRRYGGTGLGLSIARRPATLMQGEIRVENTPGTGTCFTVSVAFRDGAHLTPAPPRRNLRLTTYPCPNQMTRPRLRGSMA